MKKNVFLSSLIKNNIFESGIPGAGIPGYFITSPTGQEQINLVGSGPYIETVYLSQTRDASGYQVIQEQVTNTVNVPNGVSVITFWGDADGTATITTAPNPYDGQRLTIFSQAGISALTLTANTGQTIYNPVVSLSGNTSVTYIYNLSATTWYRMQ